MKIKITRPDGTIIEAEGSVEQCQEFALALSPASTPVPASAPVPAQQLPWGPAQPSLPWGPQPWDVQPHQQEIAWWPPDMIWTTNGRGAPPASWQCTPTGVNLC